jgi:hypothetical protein
VGGTSLPKPELLVDENLGEQKAWDQPSRKAFLAPGCLLVMAKKANEAAAPPKKTNGFGAQFLGRVLLK